MTSILANRLRCPHCLEVKAYLQQPKLLPCGHMFCSPCLESLSVVSENQTKFVCSYCRWVSDIIKLNVTQRWMFVTETVGFYIYNITTIWNIRRELLRLCSAQFNVLRSLRLNIDNWSASDVWWFPIQDLALVCLFPGLCVWMGLSGIWQLHTIMALLL